MKFYKPPHIPDDPEKSYKGQGWRGWDHFLGLTSPTAKIQEEHRLAIWCIDQKLAYADKAMSGMQIKKLELIPGWKWELTDDELKSKLLDMAVHDEPRPEPNSMLGKALTAFTTPPKNKG